MSGTDDHGDRAGEAVSAILRERGLAKFEIVERAPLPAHPAGDLAVLVRFPDAPPEILIVRGGARDRETDGGAEAILRDAVDLYAQASRKASELLRRYGNERDRTAIMETLRSLAAREITREQAVDALGLPGVIHLALLQHEFEIPGSPAPQDLSVDLMQDIVRDRVETWNARSLGIVPTDDYRRISDLRERGTDDGGIRGMLGYGSDVALPSREEIELYFDSLVYGIEPGAPPAGVTVSVSVGTKNAKIRVSGTDGVEAVRVANPRYAGRNLAGYVDEALDRMYREESLPEPRKW